MCSQMPTLALKIQWLLQSRLDASSKDSEPVIRNLLKACHSAAIRRCGNMEMLNQIPTEDQRSSVKFCPDSSEHHPLVATDASSSNITPVQHTNTDRLANLHNELGMGEGVTALVRASLLNLGRGGTGVVLPSSDAEDRRGQTFDSSIGKSQHCFYPTLKFFEMLCNCAQGIMQLPQKSRHSELRQRLEACNRYLFHGQPSQRCCGR
uniref:Phosphatidylinositol 4-kinase n=1 Tax=Ulva partita TaxID=1605170 RepID=A0A1C9ZPN6_9CHLO|nr:phosphatidylinositol 4-kinase [Ulva partita]BAV58262.1 phosphatidylinositol 4-kinase [Ulva partita]